MAKNNKSNKYEIVDFFANIAGGNKKLVTRIPHLPQVPPLEIDHEELPETQKIDIKYPKFDEKKEFNNFLREKKALRKHYEPFLQNYAKSVSGPVKKERLIDFDYRKEMPGPICRSEDEIIEVINKNDFPLEKVVEFKHKYFNYFDGNSTKRVVELIDKLMNK